MIFFSFLAEFVAVNPSSFFSAEFGRKERYWGEKRERQKQITKHQKETRQREKNIHRHRERQKKNDDETSK